MTVFGIARWIALVVTLIVYQIDLQRGWAKEDKERAMDKYDIALRETKSRR